MANVFTGFPAQTLAFCRDLTENNNKQWFDAHKSDHHESVQTPTQAFVAELGVRLQKLSKLNRKVQGVP